MHLTRNLHTIDQAIRLLLGIACIYLGIIDQEIINNKTISILIIIFGFINLAAGLSRHCMVYKLAGISTYHKENRKI
ncbi:MAG: DUF2892 domain-containing protein [Gammaproteobacteria bacterium]|nr:DUF2892 domain-containing protein [Gammaproteobacteria bacterium]